MSETINPTNTGHIRKGFLALEKNESFNSHYGDTLVASETFAR